MAKNRKYSYDEGNLWLGSIYLLVCALLALSTMYDAPIFSLVNSFLGWGMYPTIVLFLGLSLKNLRLYSELSTPYALLAQILLIVIASGLGYSFDHTSKIFDCTNYQSIDILSTCNFGTTTGSFFVDFLGDEASRIFLILLTIVLVPVGLNISFDKIHAIITNVSSIVLLVVNYIALGLATIWDFISNILYELEERRKIARDQRQIDSNERRKNPKSVRKTEPQYDEDLGEDESWVNPEVIKTNFVDDYIIPEVPKKTRRSIFTRKSSKEEEVVDEDKYYTQDEPQDDAQSPKREVNILTKEDIANEDLNEAIISISGLQYPDWELPSLKILDRYEAMKIDKSDIRVNSAKIERTYQSFNMKVDVVNAVVGPTVTQYQMNIATGVSVKSILVRQPDVALALGVNGIRIEPIPGQSLIGLEVPNRQKSVVKFSEIAEELRKNYRNMRLGCALGKSIDCNPILFDLQKMPHVLVAGTTGSGKSVLTNSIIMSLLMTKSPDELKLILVDPKKVEFSDYNDIPHLLTPVIVDTDKVMNAIKWAVEEMERRYSILSNARVRNIEGYNEKAGFSAMPYIAIIIDEVADLMGSIGKAFEAEVLRIAQKARATGIHLVLATQRPSVDVITGVLKGNIPGRLALKVASQQDSRVILDRNGAETLVGYGDMLFGDPGKPSPSRIQGVWIDPKEILRVVDFVKAQVPDELLGKNYNENITAQKGGESDTEIEAAVATDGLSSGGSLLKEALKVIYQSNKFSVSMLQTYLGIGFNKAARMKMELEKGGYITPSTTKSGAYDINREKIVQSIGDDNPDDYSTSDESY